MLYENKIKLLGLNDAEAAAELNGALEKFVKSVDQDPNAIGWLMDNIGSRSKGEGLQPEIEIHVKMWELDYSFGIPVYSATPRLLLQVPKTYRDQANAGKPIEHNEIGPKQNVPKLGYGGAPLPPDSTIIFPNQEGDQPDVAQRPVVQWSGIKPGEYMILGKFLAKDEERIRKIMESVIGTPASGKNIWQHYTATATVEDLSDIMNKLRAAGFSNQYNTTAKYLETTKPHDGKKRYTRAAGLYSRDRDKELCTAIYFPGEVELGFHPREIIEGGGFAVAIKKKTGSELDFRPVSTDFMQGNYRHMFTNKPVKPIEGVINIWFVPGHPLRKYSNQLGLLLKDLHAVNLKVRQKNTALMPQRTKAGGKPVRPVEPKT